MTRTLVDPDCVRACVHYFTLPSEIDQLVEGIQKFCQIEARANSPNMSRPILYVAITNHGFGHAARTASVAAIQKLCPEILLI